MKVIILIVLLAFATTASALDLKIFVDDCTKNLTSLLDVIEDLIKCVVAVLTAIVNQLVKLLQDLLTLDLGGIVEEVIELIPNVLRAVECDCTPIIEDVLKVVQEILALVVQLLEGEGTLLARFLASLIELLLGGAAANGMNGASVAEFESL